MDEFGFKQLKQNKTKRLVQLSKLKKTDFVQKNLKQRNNEHRDLRVRSGGRVECLDVSLSHPADCTHSLMMPRRT